MAEIFENQILDASSKFEDSLPISSIQLMNKLDEWSISYKCHNHIPLKTVEDSKKHQSQFLNFENGGGHIKNLYLRDHKKNNILIVAEQNCLIDLKNLSKLIFKGRLSFGTPTRLMENLGVRPGAVTPFSMINDIKKNVDIFIDSKLKNCLKIYAHPLVNDKTLEISPKNLYIFFNKLGVTPKWIDFN
jgi:Ala-tRNA(Pro) deacylase